MAEETSLPEGTEAEATPVETGTTTASTPEYSDVEQRAMAQGWVPKEQWDGHGKWRDAEEFLDRGELFSKIDEQNRKLRSTEAVVGELRQHLKKVRETEYNRALAALRAEKKQALDEGDTEKVVELDEKIADTKQAQRADAQKFDTPPPQDATPNPAFVAWVNRNQWYQNDRVMKAAADAIADDLVANGEKNPTRILQEVEKRVKQEFPNKFVNPNRARAGSVEAGGAKGSQRGESFDLTPEEIQVMNKFVKHGVMTKEEYIADIKAQRKGQ